MPTRHRQINEFRVTPALACKLFVRAKLGERGAFNHPSKIRAGIRHEVQISIVQKDPEGGLTLTERIYTLAAD
ncbi:MAG: hypothetical protein O2960_01760 [Verrucomicrobia bacterium]|nr:hypothetical protein [Verrucomicrobiota bacterium]